MPNTSIYSITRYCFLLQLCAQDRITFAGHFVDKETQDRLHPQEVGGQIIGRNEKQVFARTAKVLEFGMCGGPAFYQDSEGTRFLAGIVEGIVPNSFANNHVNNELQKQASALIANSAVFVEVPELTELM
jgi:hypothetical protein